MPWKHRINNNRNLAGQTDLPTMRMPGKQDVEISKGGLSIKLWGVRKQNRKRVIGDLRSSLLDVICAIEMRISTPARYMHSPLRISVRIH